MSDCCRSWGGGSPALRTEKSTHLDVVAQRGLQLRPSAQGRRLRQQVVTTCIAQTLVLIIVFGCGFGCTPRSHNPPHTASPTRQSKAPIVDKVANNDDDPDTDSAPVATDSLVVDYFAIAQGNCILVTTTSGKHLLIDTAPTGYEQDVLSRLQEQEAGTLDWVLITNPTEEHAGCLPTLLGGMTIGKLLTPGIASPLESRIESAARIAGCKMSTLRAGSEFRLDTNTTLEVVAPGKSTTVPINATQDWYDNHSLVFRIKFNKAVMLFTGSMGKQERDWLNASGAKLRASVLSGLNHGDKRVADLNFIHTVSPVLTIIMSELGNRAGYPDHEVLESLQTTMSSVCRTDVQSDILVRLNTSGRLQAFPTRQATEQQMHAPGSRSNLQAPGSSPVDITHPAGEPDASTDEQGGGLP